MAARAVSAPRLTSAGSGSSIPSADDTVAAKPRQIDSITPVFVRAEQAARSRVRNCLPRIAPQAASTASSSLGVGDHVVGDPYV
jgi:hypothetical protein